MISQKCQYALRAVFELAKSARSGPCLLKIEHIAKAQKIPVRFLENILNQLRTGGFVASRRGRCGGYLLARDPADITVGEIIRFMDGPLEDIAGSGMTSRRRLGPEDEVFSQIWLRAGTALATVLDQPTLADLVEEFHRLQPPGLHHNPDYVI